MVPVICCTFWCSYFERMFIVLWDNLNAGSQSLSLWMCKGSPTFQEGNLGALFFVMMLFCFAVLSFSYGPCLLSSSRSGLTGKLAASSPSETAKTLSTIESVHCFGCCLRPDCFSLRLAQLVRMSDILAFFQRKLHPFHDHLLTDFTGTNPKDSLWSCIISFLNFAG